ncbi:MAG: tetratricopeptide repeat protein [Flavobacteriaceae bacterium]
MSRRLLLFLVFNLSLVFTYAQNDSISKYQKELKKAKGFNKINLLITLSQHTVDIADSLALDYAQKAYALSKNLDQPSLICETAYQLGKVYKNSSDNLALKYLNEAENISIKENLALKTAIYETKLDIYRRKGWFPKALEYGIKTLNYFLSTKDSTKIADISNKIAFTYDRMGNYKEAINWNKRALTILKNNKNKKLKGLCLGGIGIAYDELKQSDSALYYNKKAVKIFKELKKPSLLRVWYSNIGNTYSKQNKLDKAEEYTLKSLSVPGFLESKGVTLVNLGKIYLEKGHYKEAQKILDSALQNTLKYRQRRFESEAYYRFHELNLKLKNYKKALTYYKKYQTIEDSLMNSGKQRQIIEISTRYKTSEKERALAKKDVALTKEVLKSKSRSLYAILLGSALIIVLIYSYFFRRQHRLENLRIKEEYKLKEALSFATTQNKLQEQRLRISRDLHDNIGSQLSFIISSIENLKFLTNPKNNKLLDKLSKIITFSDDTISQLRDTIWAMDQNEISLNDFEGRVLNFIDKAKSSYENVTFNFINNSNIKVVFNASQGINLYRIVQEAINNTLKYAEAATININFDKTDKNLVVNISDDGKGFSLTDVKLGNGLNNIKKRTDDIEASVKIKSDKNKGTTIIIEIPLNTLNIVL